MSNRMKALYTIVLPKSGDNSNLARMAEDVNQEHLNDNFRTIVNELLKLWSTGEHDLNLLSARISADEKVFVTAPDAEGIAAEAIANSAVILMMPDTIMHQVSEVLTGYATITDVDNASDATLAAAQEVTTSTVQQKANELSVTISRNTSRLDESQEILDDLTSWVRIVTANSQAGTKAGVIIGDSKSSTSLKAEAGAIFFYRGEDAQAKVANQLAGFDADGNFIASDVHTESMLLDNKFDVDVVTAGGVDFLHITGRN